jgi:glucose/arabinose dehydrogenase
VGALSTASSTGRSLTRAFAGACAAAVLLAGCSGDDEPDTTAAEPTTTTTGQTEPGETEDGRIPVGDGRGGVRLREIGRFERPVYLTQPASGSDDLFVVEQGGRVMQLPADGGEPTVFLDLSDEVSSGNEQGLLSAAFAADYERTGRLYIDYTDTGGDTHVVEYRRDTDEDVADPESARELLRVEQPFANHNGGLVVFGPDENLYIGLGDGGSGGDPQRNGQNLGTLLGKILRIDPRPGDGEPYRIPEGNPFRDRQGARPEILAYGLRNPWRFSFDAERLWIGDVGQDNLEEIDGPIAGLGAGANFGWSAFEGTERFNDDQEAPDAIPPTLTYGRDSGCSVTGGYVVRDPSLPSLYGRYLYADYCEGELRSFTPQPGGEAEDDRALGPTVARLSSFGEDASGRIYATSLEGPVYRLSGAE